MKLYYSPGACSLADHIALIEAEIPHETVNVDLKAKTTEAGEDFWLVNPKGYVPALEIDDGEVLTENIAVLLYIADEAGRLAPAPWPARYRLIELLAFISTELHKSFKPFFAGGSDDDQAAARKQIAGRLDLIELQTGNEFIMGETMTVADCYLFVMLMWATKTAGMKLPPRLAAYFERLQERPSIRQALAEEGLG